ncbi:MAG: DNA polymerase IV [Candidatus Brocadiia bacterium]
MDPTERVIIHIDMDAFFAAIEQRDNPEYKGKPVVVGADPKGGEGRGVVSTCSYEAREYGIHSAQPISEAYRRCPHAVFLHVRGERYAEESRRIRDILREFTPDIEPISIDEAFLDVTGTMHLFGGKKELAAEIARRVKERTGLTASLGVAPNKMIAKIASDLEKPEGLVIVEPDEVRSFLDPLPVEKLWGVGEKTLQSLHSRGIETIGDLARCRPEELEKDFGKQGPHLWKLARGEDRRPVETEDETKSVGHEHTFEVDTDDLQLLRSTLMKLSEKVARRLRRGGWHGRTVTTKVRLEDFSTFTRRRTLDRAVNSAPQLFEIAEQNFQRAYNGEQKVRLVGVSVSGLEPATHRQTTLFEKDRDGRNRREKWRKLGPTIDEIVEKFGEDALQQGTSFRIRQENEKKDPGKEAGT